MAASPGDMEVTLNWTAVSGAASYNLYWSTTAGVTPATGIKVASVTSPKVLSGLNDGTAYYYVVTAVNVGGESAASLEVTATPQLQIPAVPTGVAASPDINQATLSWDAIPKATNYNLYWSTTNGTIRNIGTRISNATSPYVQTGLTNNVTYYYVVTALNAAGESAASPVVAATPAPYTTSSGSLVLPTTPATGSMAITGSSTVSATSTLAAYTSSFAPQSGSGVTAVSYQWYLDGSSIAGATNAGYQANPSTWAFASHVLALFVTGSNGIIYSQSLGIQMQRSNAAGSGSVQVNSPPLYGVTLQVTQNGVVTSQIGRKSGTANNVVVASAFTGTPSTHQWYVDSALVTGPGGVVLSVTGTLTLDQAAMTPGMHTISSVIGDSEGIKASSSVVINVFDLSVAGSGSVVLNTPANNPVSIAGASQVITTSSAQVSFASSYGGIASAYQWFFDGAALYNGTGISGATMSTLNLTPSAMSLGAGLHMLAIIITDSTGTKASGTWSFAAYGPAADGSVSIAIQLPQKGAVAIAGPAIISQGLSSAIWSASYGGTAAANGYQWLWDGAPASNLTGASGTNLAAVTLTPVHLSPGLHSLTVYVTDVGGVRCSATISVDVMSVVGILGPAALSQASFSGSYTSTYSAAASGAYQWLWDGAAISGATANSLSLPCGIVDNTAAQGIHFLSLRITDSNGSLYSSGVFITVTP